MSHPSAYIAGPLSIPPSSQPDLSYVDDIYDPNLDPNLLDSEQTTTSVIDPEFTQPALVNSSLQRVGPDRRKQFVLYNAMNNASKVKFIEWWRTTVRGGDQEAQRKVRWDAKHISDIWKGFDQVAHHITGEPMVMCRSCGILLSHPHSKQTGTNSMKRHQSSGKCQKGLRNQATQQSIKQTIQHAATHEASRGRQFSQDEWEREQIEFITALNLPFRTLGRKQLDSLIEMAQKASTKPTLLQPRTAQRRLKKIVYEEHYTIFSTLPLNARLSIALDCWTSPFQQAFMAITGYLLIGTGITENFYLASSHSMVRILAVQDSTDALNLPGSPVVVRIPCLAHVIQLSLRELLGSVKADPQNDTSDRTVSNIQAQARSLHGSKSQQVIMQTLTKIRGLAVFINASPQRREDFFRLQTTGPKLTPLQDVRTRWNSTFLMLRRAKRLSKFYDEYCDNIGTQKYKLSKAEWRRIDYLLYITEPFYRYTTVLSKTKEITVHHVFGVYNALFDHFKKSIERLRPKTIPWKVAMLNALEAGMQKLTSYYAKTKEIHGSLYAIGTILAPQHKLSFFSSKAWGKSTDDTTWSDKYKEILREFMDPYTQRHFQTQSLLGEQPLQGFSASTSDFDALVELRPQVRPDPSNSDHELTRYLEKPRKNVDPLQFWKEYEQESPILSSVARDILSIPATGAGVERLFNTARDICHYRRGQLNPKTIQDIIMFRLQEADEQREAELAAEVPEAISDMEDSDEDEEDNEDDDDPVRLIEQESLIESQRRPTSTVSSARKRRRSVSVDSEDETSPPLPSHGDEGSTQRRPGLREARKRGKPDDDQFVRY
ncbi:hypothetical protein PENNAL_c0284G08124 [Penicillium nalgiovense]|uniref:HAT C-terminal dimerisation domain-containing protein n=1 Tax=Penicillium nalgiovense TaxID=60175 RepID=A0A1V6WF52_PENNA|nr:hypothetical protein PENNAL_c0284G08124 [Penicillium nalgiovense]